MLREWRLNLKLNLKRRPGGAPVYVQIAHGLVAEIRRGRLIAGEVLPGSREMAEELCVNRKTVVVAYDELIAQGWLTSRGTKGTFVSAKLPEPKARGTRSALDGPRSRGEGPQFSRLAPTMDIPVLFPRPGVLSLDDGTPDTRLFPTESFSRAYRSAMTIGGKVGKLGYGDPRAAGANILRVRVDDNGTDMDSLEKTCRRHRVRLVYLTPHHHFPTTVLLNPDRRLRLLGLASQFGFTIVEDDYDHEFHFQHQPLLPLASFDPSVLYIGSMSKLLSPSLRLGYISAPEKFIERAAQEICLIDRQGDPVTEDAVAELVESGEVRRHANRVLKIYAARREKLAVMLRAELGDAVDFRLPDGGLAFWLTFATSAHLDRLEQNAPKHGLQFLPSRSFAAKEDGPRGIRVGFAGLDDAGIRDAVRRMKAAIGL